MYIKIIHSISVFSAVVKKKKSRTRLKNKYSHGMNIFWIGFEGLHFTHRRGQGNVHFILTHN